MFQGKIFLVGMPGSGKSTLGKKLAELLRISFFDLDKEIEKHKASTISQIFKSSGEEYFRTIESQILKNLILSESNFVCATGGGTACFNDNILIMNEAGITIFLDVPVQTLLKRIQEDQSQRPLLDGEPIPVLTERVTKFSEQRRKYYAQSKFIFSGSSITVEEIRERLFF